uniref:E3 ubiquitin-protein ligase n=1 Tax=Pithovirus LCPAC101 TaxID=2506586 RepID=A0A481Z4B6_9VIRU|nr:MAG: E3 ubiquitin-protein ligase [Pithovirus LCPAC101]
MYLRILMNHISKDCDICFDVCDNPVMCQNMDCSSHICPGCTKLLIDFSLKENKIPLCPGNNCMSNFTYNILMRSFKNTSIFDKPVSKSNKSCNEIIISVGKCYIKYFMNTHENEIKYYFQQKATINQIRLEKLDYIRRSFPIGISLISSIALKHKLNKCQSYQNKLSDNIKKLIPCIFSHCKGFLNNNYRCMSCHQDFCSDCHEKKNDWHVCKEDDLATINELKKLIKCPTCKLAVDKMSGCDSVTCPNCHTHFDYKTGKIGGHGGHSHNLNPNLDKTTLINMHKDSIIKRPDSNFVLRLLEEIESNSQKKSSDRNIIKLVGKYKEDPIENNIPDIVKAFDKFTKDTLNYRKYIMYIMDIDKQLRTDTLDISQLKIIHKYYCK